MVRAATTSGVRHRLAGAGPDDTYAWAALDGAVAAAVADGVSGRAGSAAAAAAAADAAVAALAAGDDPAAAVRAADAAARGSTGATTLVVALVDAGGRARLASVGDSGALVLDGGTWREVWPAPGDPGVVTTATAALPADDPAPVLAEVVLAPGAALVLGTDGVLEPLRDGPTTVAPGLAAALGTPPDPLELLRVLDFSRQGCHDDRTLLVVWAVGDPPAG